jgi:glutathione S-transferase
MAIKLYYAPGACSFASHIALEEAGLTYDTQKMNLAEGDQKKPEYLRLNPRGRVPTLVVDGQVLTENVGILTYVGGGYPQAGLWPKKTWDQAKLVSTLAWLSNTVHPAYAHIVRPERYATDDASKENIKARAKDVFQGYLEEIDQLLEGQKWTVANQFTVADGYLLVFYRWANRQKMPVRELKNYSALVQRVMARPAVQRVMAQEGITLES